MELPSISRRPIVEINVLSRDGKVQQQPQVRFTSTSAALADEIEYYAVYQVTRGPVALSTPELTIAPGQRKRVSLELENRVRGPRARAVAGTVKLVPHVPSLTSETETFKLVPGAKCAVPLTLIAREDVDWGGKTVVFDVEVDGRHSYFWRTLLVKRLPDLRVTTPVIAAQTRKTTVASVEFPWAKDAVAEDVALTVGTGDGTKVGDLGPGESREVVLPLNRVAPAAPAFEEKPARLDYTVGGVKRSRQITVGVVGCPRAYVRARDAVAPLIVCNPHDEYLENMLVSHAVDRAALGGKAPCYVRERGGNVVASQVVGDTLYWIAMLPPKSASLYYLCAGEATQPKTDLTVSKGPEGITVSNSVFALAWSGEQGGTLTTFKSHATGRDYAAGSFGGGHGTWGKFDLLSPRTNTVKFVGREVKTWQRDAEGTAQVKVGLRGPVLVTVDVEVEVHGAKYSQHYMIGAFQSDFTVRSELTLAEKAEELVALDVRLARNHLTKIFPNFTGIAAGFQKDSPHAGWREASYVPPYATVMTPNRFEESISVIPWTNGRNAGITKFRQGFWPEHRPRVGPVKYAEIELVATDTDHAAAGARILLHPGHQVVAKRLRKTHVTQPPTIIVPRGFEWRGRVGASGGAPPPHWWSPYWYFAAPVTVGPIDPEAKDPRITFKPGFDGLLGARGTFDPASPRAIARSNAGVTELPFWYEAESGRLTVTLIDAAWPDHASAMRELMLYFDTIGNGPKRMAPAPDPPPSAKLLNGSFEDRGTHWSGPSGFLHKEGAHTGQCCARLECKAKAAFVLSNRTMRVRPRSKYLVSFWARTTTPEAALRTNFYAGAKLDFPQFAIPLKPDGEWHRYDQALPVGELHSGVNPGLRFWVLAKPSIVYLDDVKVEAIGPSAATAQPAVKIGQLLSR